MESLPFVNEFSFRASYGHSGKAPNRDYLFYSNINSYSPTYLGEAGTFPANMAYRNLKFERVKGMKLGLNLALWERRFRLGMEVYRNRTTAMMFDNLGIHTEYGIEPIWLNAA